MAIRYDAALNAEIRKVVRNFNQKRNRAIKRGYHFLPPLLTVSELKSRYTSRPALKRELKLLSKFNTDRDEALRVVETSGGAKAIKWEYDYLKANIRYAKQYYERQIAEAASLDRSQLALKSELLNNMTAKRDYLDLELSELTPSQFRTYRATINEYIRSNERAAKGYRGWLNEVEFLMRNLGYDNKTIDRFFEGFDQLTPQQFLKLYQENSLVSRIYELYIPTRDFGFRLSTTEEDARNMIDTFMLEKDEMIRTAKAQKEMDKQTVKQIVEELNDKKTVRISYDKQGRAKLNRKDLTPKEIRDLETLGWGDLIE